MIRAVNLYSYQQDSKFFVRVKRQHSECLHTTGHRDTIEDAIFDAYSWMKENDFALGPYRLGREENHEEVAELVARA